MRISHLCNNSSSISRCHVPLIEICDSTSQIKLDLGSCRPCTATQTALLLVKGGCTEWEVVCDQQPTMPCCGVVDARPKLFNKRLVEKPKPSVIYPIHEIDSHGMSVFVLDGKLKELGYGRYKAKILVQDYQDGEYRDTGLEFDVDYIENNISIINITTETFQPNLGEC